MPAGADTNVNLAYGDIPPGTGPIATVEAPDKVNLQPQVKHRTQACAYVDYSDDSAGFQGPFCAGSDTSGDGKADPNTFGPEWITKTDPSGRNVRRSNGLILHWADMSAERHVDVGNCVNPTLLFSEPGLAAGFNELTQWNVTGRMRVRLVGCNAATQEVRAFNQDLGDNGVYGRADFSWFGDGHVLFNYPGFANPTFFVNDFYVKSRPDAQNENVVKHEIGHNLGIAHDDRTANIMNATIFGTSTEVDQNNRDTINFLYSHTDPYDANSGDGSPPAGHTGSIAAHDPVAKQLAREGEGARVTVPEGAYETVTYTKRADNITSASITVYAPTETGREAAAAAVASAPLGG